MCSLFNFDPKMTSFSCGRFLCPRSLGRAKKCPEGRFRTRWIDWHLFHEYLLGVQKWNFFLSGGRGYRANFDQFWPNFKVVIFNLFKSLGTSACRENHLGIILSKNKALTKNLHFSVKIKQSGKWKFLTPSQIWHAKRSSGRMFQNALY